MDGPPLPAVGGTGVAPLGQILSRAFDSYSQQWSAWLLPVLLCGLIFIGAELACVIPALFAMGALSCALYACAMHNLRGRPVDTAILARGWDVFWPASLAGIALMLIQAVPVFLLYGLMFVGMLGVSRGPAQPGGNIDNAAATVVGFGLLAAIMLCVFVVTAWTVYISTRTMFVMPLVADRGYGFSDAWHASWEATRRRFWERLLLVVLAGIVSSLGTIACYIGVIFTLPLYFLIVGAAYEDEFGIALDEWRPPSAPMSDSAYPPGEPLR